MSYGWAAEEEVSLSPREFRFVTTCADCPTDSNRLNIVLWPYTASPGKAEEALAKLGFAARQGPPMDHRFENQPRRRFTGQQGWQD
jgi:hypothetical protein